MSRDKGIFLLNHFHPRIEKVKQISDEEYNRLEIERFIESPPPQIPTSVSIRISMTPVRDQASGQHCCSFGTVACLEFIHQNDLSESHLAHGAENNYGNCTEGLAMSHSFKYCKDHGIVEEHVWPYDDHQICWEFPPNIHGHPVFRFNNYYNSYRRKLEKIIEKMKADLRGGHVPIQRSPNLPSARIIAVLAKFRIPVAIDVPVWWTSSGVFDAGWEIGPDIHMPTPVNLALWLTGKPIDYAMLQSGKIDDQLRSAVDVDGWHVIAITGYDNRTNRFEFKNSWGDWWGDQGYGTIPYDYVNSYSREGYFGI